MRVAVCLSGQMRSFRECAPHLIENVVKPLGADVFIHTWANVGFSTKLFVHVPHELHPIMPRGYDHDVVDLGQGTEPSPFERTFPTLYRLISDHARANQVVTAEELTGLYGARACVVEDYEERRAEIATGFDLESISKNIGSLGLNTIPMYYKIWACDQLRQDAEKTDGKPYDVVIRMRPDYMVLGQIPPNVLMCSGGLSNLHNPSYDTAGIKNATFDAMAIGSASAITYYCSIWEQLSTYFSDGVDPAWPADARGAESILYRHLSKINAAKNLFKPRFHIFRQASYIDQMLVIDALLDDIREQNEFIELKKRLTDYRNEHFGAVYGTI